jgi:hypothetical protein
MGIHFLGELALDPEVRIGGDSGSPVASRASDDSHAMPFLALAKDVEQRCREAQGSGPSITVED